MKNLAVLLTLMVMGNLSLFAGDATLVVKARVDFNSKDVVLTAIKATEGGLLENIKWGDEEKRKFKLTGETIQLTTDKWITDAFIFMPENDGIVDITLKSNYLKDRDTGKMHETWVFYDEIVVEGAILVNGDFENIDSKGKMVNWFCKPENIVKDGAKPFSGKVMIKAWHNMKVFQFIKVTKGKPVTIIINFKKVKVKTGK